MQGMYKTISQVERTIQNRKRQQEGMGRGGQRLSGVTGAGSTPCLRARRQLDAMLATFNEAFHHHTKTMFGQMPNHPGGGQAVLPRDPPCPAPGPF